MKYFNLNNEKINPGFKVPEGYFEAFENKMLDNLVVQKEKKVIHLFPKKQLFISSIAAVFVMAIAIPSYFNFSKKVTLENATIENYLINQTNFSSFDIIDKLNENDIKELENTLATSENNSVESYLLDTQNLDYYLNE
jgi:hypothetical protein